MKLLELQILMQMRENSGDWIDQLNSAALETIDDRVDALLTDIRPEAVTLVDGFGFSDGGTTLGREDGNVYEAIYEQAKMSPLNKSPKMVGWEHLGKVVDLEFLK